MKRNRLYRRSNWSQFPHCHRSVDNPNCSSEHEPKETNYTSKGTPGSTFCASSLKRGIKRSSIQRKFYYIRCSKPQFICKKAIIWHISCSAWSFPQTFLDAVFRLPAQSFSFLLWLILSTITVGISPRTTFSHFQSLKFLCWFWSSYLDIFLSLFLLPFRWDWWNTVFKVQKIH